MYECMCVCECVCVLGWKDATRSEGGCRWKWWERLENKAGEALIKNQTRQLRQKTCQVLLG